MLSDTLLLLRNYWTIDRRGDSRQGRAARLISYGVAVIGGIAISALAGAAAGIFITNPDLPLRIRLGTVPGLLLSLVLAGTLFAGVNQALRALYLTNDMELLFSAPVRTESVLAAKLLSRLPATVIITLILTIPALILFGITTGLGPAFYVAGTIALLLAPLFGLSAGALLAMLIVRVLPAQRVSEYLGAASIILGVLLAILFNLPRFFVGGEQEELSPEAFAAVEGVVGSIESIPLPTMWAGQGLVDLAQGRIVASLGSLSLYLLMTAGFFALTILLANQLYLSGWLRMQGSGITRGGYSEQAGLFGGASLEAGIGTKDWLVRIRDARQLATLLSGLIFAAFFGFLLLRPRGGSGLLQGNEGDPGNVLAALFTPGVAISGVILYAGWITFSRAALTSLAIEGRSLYILKAAPLEPRIILRSKVLSLVLPFAALSLLLLLLAWFFLRFSIAWVPYAWLCLVIIGYGMITISTTFGFLYPKLDWDDPRRMVSGRASLRNLILGALYGLVAIVLAVLPFLIAFLYPRYTLPVVLVGLLLLAGMAWLVERWSQSRVAKAWPEMELVA